MEDISRRDLVSSVRKDPMSLGRWRNLLIIGFTVGKDWPHHGKKHAAYLPFSELACSALVDTPVQLHFTSSLMLYDFFSSASTSTTIVASPMSVPSEDTEAPSSTVRTATEEAALFSTVNKLLVVLDERLQDRPHGQFTLLQLPDIFLIKSQLEQVLELKAKEEKHQETLVQMAMDREEEGIKGAKKRVKITGTQSAAIRQAVVEEVDNKTADSQRHIANLEDRLKKAEKMLEAASNEIQNLADEKKFLVADLGKIAKAPKAPVQKNSQGNSPALEARLQRIEQKVEHIAFGSAQAESDIKLLAEEKDIVHEVLYDEVDGLLVSKSKNTQTLKKARGSY